MVSQKIEVQAEKPEPANEKVISMDSKEDNRLRFLNQQYMEAISNELPSSQEPSSYLSSSHDSSVQRFRNRLDKLSKNASS